MIETLVAGILIALLARFAEERGPAFPPTDCRYCPGEIHYDRAQLRWVHANGLQWAPTPRVSTIGHIAWPTDW